MLLRDLKRDGHAVILASSAGEEAEHYLDLLDARGSDGSGISVCTRSSLKIIACSFSVD
jgi:hypothetical protein